MPINIYSVTNDLESQGWKLISTEYKNLNTELEMLCPEGHTQLISYGKWRKHPICEKCLAGDPYKVKKNKVPIKKIDTYRVLALDAATKITGYSIYDNDTLVSYGTYHTDEDKDAEARINDMKHWLEIAIDTWQPDFIGVENVQLQSFGANGKYQVEMYRILANLQGVIIDTLFEKNVPHALCYATEWRKYCGVGEGKGRENKKRQAQEKVELWYQQKCTQDEADAICIGKYFCHYIKNKTSSWGEDIP